MKPATVAIVFAAVLLVGALVWAETPEESSRGSSPNVSPGGTGSSNTVNDMNRNNNSATSGEEYIQQRIQEDRDRITREARAELDRRLAEQRAENIQSQFTAQNTNRIESWTPEGNVVISDTRTGREDREAKVGRVGLNIRNAINRGWMGRTSSADGVAGGAPRL